MAISVFVLVWVHAPVCVFMGVPFCDIFCYLCVGESERERERERERVGPREMFPPSFRQKQRQSRKNCQKTRKITSYLLQIAALNVANIKTVFSNLAGDSSARF